MRKDDKFHIFAESWRILTIRPTDEDTMVSMFVLLNVTTVNTKRVIVDKDTCEITAVRDTFTSNHSIQLCEFHVTQCTVSTTSSATINRLSNAHIVFYVMWKGTQDCFSLQVLV